MFTFLISVAAMAQQSPQPAVEPMRTDGKGRPMVAATVDGKGPFDVMIDTAAGSTVMKDEAARLLGLALAGDTINVSGVAGGEEARLYKVERFASNLFDLRDAEIPGVSSIGATQAQMIAGIDLFEGRKLVIDGVRNEARVDASGPAPAGFAAVRGRYLRGKGLVVPVMVNGVEIRGLVDTGAEGCVAGSDVLRALGWRSDDPRLTAYGQIGGAAGGASNAQVASMDNVTIGPATIKGIRIVFAEALSNHRSEPGEKPIMVIGLNLLNALKIYALDLPRGELQLTTTAPSKG